MKKKLSGLLAVLAAGAAVALAACSSSPGTSSAAVAEASGSTGEAPITLTVGYFKGSDIDAFTANSLGYFKQEGITVKFVLLAAGPQLISATATGAIDIGYGDTFAFASAINNGFTDLRLIRSSGPTNYETLDVGKNSGISSAADLNGKKIGVTPTPFTQVLIKAYAASGGANPNSIKFTDVPVGGQATAVDSGEVDGVYSFDAFTNATIEAAGGKALPIDGVRPAGSSGANYYATTKFIQAHPGVVQRFVAALEKADVLYNSGSISERIKLTSNATGIDYQAEAAHLPGLLTDPTWNGTEGGPLSIAATQAWVNMGVKYGAIAKPINIAPYVYATATETSGG